MSNAAAASSPTDQGTRAARRRAVAGCLIVADHVGEAAADAAQAVRRTGLKPGLERSFGWESALIGLVVAQEPGAGEEVTRNGLVRLYIAAPAAGESVELADPVPSSVSAASHERAAPSQPPPPRRRRRKSRPDVRTASPRARADWSQAPRGASPVTASAEFDLEADTDQLVAFRVPDGDAAAGGAQDPWPEQQLRDADRLFAAASDGPAPWRSRYPRTSAHRAWRSPLASARRHPALCVMAGTMLTAWALVAILAAESGPSRHAPVTHRTTSAGEEASRKSTPLMQRRTASPAPHAALRSGAAPRARRRTAMALEQASPRAQPPAQTPGAGTTPSAQPVRTAAPDSQPTHTGEQTGGGPFSP